MKKILFLFSLMILAISTPAQVLIDDTNTAGATPDGSAALEVRSNDKGLLLPRLSQAPTATSPNNIPAGLIYFDSTSNTFKGFDGSKWVEFSSIPVTTTPSCANPVDIVSFGFDGDSGDAVDKSVNTPVTNVINTKISRGSGLNAEANADSFNATGGDATTLADAISNNDYFEITFEIANGATADLTAFDFNWRVSGNGNNNVALRSSVDNYSTNVGSYAGIGDREDNIITLNNHNGQNNTVTFRLYVWGTASATDEFGFEGNARDVIVMGCLNGGTPPVIQTFTQDFESSTGANVLPFAVVGGNTGYTYSVNNLYPPENTYVSPSNGYGISNGIMDLDFGTVDTSSASSSSVSFRLASFSGNNSNGADQGDFVLVSISSDNGTTWSEELKIIGNNNKKYGFSATGLTSVSYDGNNSPTEVTTQGGNDGITTVTINSLPNAANLKVRITAENDHNNEYWIIDDVVVTVN